MNTERSEQFIKAWKRRGNPLKRGSFVTERTFQTSPQTLFALLCPTTELDWVPNWECELLHSESGYAEWNAVFKTRFFGPEEVWVCTRYEPHRVIAFSRTSDNVSSTLAISLADCGDGSVATTWDLTASALNEQGNAAIAELELGQEIFAAALDALEHYLDTGQMAA